MLYKHNPSGRTMEVAEGEATKRRILERSGWFVVAQPTPVVVVPEPVAPAVTDDLPEGFPQREALTAAGFGALLLVTKASDEELLAIDGIGKATLEKIRAAA